MTRFSVGRIQELAGQLIVAQEAERERIARELHDDVGQQLAGLSLALSGLRRRIAQHDQAVLEASLTTLQQQTMGLADTVARLAHELHPGELRQIGLVEALKIRCDEFQQNHGVEVTFGAAEDLMPIAPDVALCLFRAAQEALRNVAKHARARRTQVVLSHGTGQRTLTIADDGQGFDVAHARQESEGLGLRIMEERARLLHGSVQVESDAGRGTTVRISIPTATI